MLSRRNFFKGTVAGAFGYQFAHQIDNPGLLLNILATAELFSASLYTSALQLVTDLTEEEHVWIKTIALSEWDHYQLFSSIGGRSASTTFSLDNFPSDKLGFIAVVEPLKTSFVTGYLTFLGMLTSIADEKLAITAAQIATVESQHLALLRHIGGLLPIQSAFSFYAGMTTSDAISGLDNLMGSSGTAQIVPPSESDMAAIREELMALGYNSTTQPAIDI